MAGYRRAVATTSRSRFLANLEDSVLSSESDSDEDNELLISFRRPRRTGSATVMATQSPPAVRPRRGASSRPASANRNNLKRSAVQASSSSSVAAASASSSHPKRSRFNAAFSQETTEQNLGAAESTGDPPVIVSQPSVRLSDLLAEFDVGELTAFTSRNEVGSNSDEPAVVSSGYDSQVDGGSAGGSPAGGSGSSEVMQGMEALEIDVDETQPRITHPYQTRRATEAARTSADRAGRRIPLLDRLLDLEDFESLFTDMTTSRRSGSEPSSPEISAARNLELDDIDGVPLQGGTEPRRGGLRRSGSLPATDRSRRSPSSVGIGRNTESRVGSTENFDVQVFLDRIDGLPLSGRTEPRSGGSLSRAASAASEEFMIDLSGDSPRPGPSGSAMERDNDIQLLAEVSPETMARIHQLELDEAMARRLQEEEDGMAEVEDLSTTRTVASSRTRFRRRPPTRRGASSGGSGEGSDVRVILPRLEQLADIVHTMMEDETTEDGAGTAADVDEPGPATRATTHATRNNRIRRGRQSRRGGVRTVEGSLTTFLDRMASSAFENSRLDYEALMDLVERIGDAGPTGLSRREIGRLPTVKYTGLEDIEQSSCTICMSDYVDNERLRLLPCTHTFHTGCIDRWLEQRSNCPICRSGVREHVAGAQT